MSVSDIVRAGRRSSDVNILKAEFKAGHRVRERIFLTKFIPSGSTGAELGVFTGLFSANIARQKQISCVTFVDPWWKAYGDYYPDWGLYTDFGRVSTRKAFQLAKRRISSANLPNRFVEVASSYDWLTDQRDESLDWVYLDTTHTYAGTKRELGLLDRKLKETGLILGDDWQPDRNHRHHGVFLAVNEFARQFSFEFVLCGPYCQWILRRSLKDPARLPLLWEDKIYSLGRGN
jgi:hypothetical protein